MTDHARPHRRTFIVLANRRARALATADAATEFAERTRAIFAAHDIAAEVRVVEPDELSNAVRDAIGEAPDALISAGGDGTVRTLAKGLRHTNIPLGVLPFGTFNLLARDLGIPLETENAIAALATAPPTRIDLAEVAGEPFLCSCSVGYFPEKLMKQDRFRGLPWWRKTAVALRALLGSYFDFRPLQITVEIDGREERFPTRLAVIVNNAYEDQPGLLPRRPRLDTGRLALYVSTHRTRWGTWRAALRFLAGRLHEDPAMRIVRSKTLALDARRPELACRVDGDIQRLPTPLEFASRPGELLVLKPDA